MSAANKLKIAKDKLHPLLNTELIENDDYTLWIRRDPHQTSFSYQPKHHWTDVITGRIELNDRIGITDDNNVTFDVGGGSGGRTEDWEIADMTSYMAAYADLHERMTSTEGEIAAIVKRRDMYLGVIKLESVVNKERYAVSIGNNPSTDRSVVKAIVKNAAKLGKQGKLTWSYLTFAGEVHTQHVYIKPRGLYINPRGSVVPTTQTKVVAKIHDNAFNLQIVVDSETE